MSKKKLTVSPDIIGAVNKSADQYDDSFDKAFTNLTSTTSWRLQIVLINMLTSNFKWIRTINPTQPPIQRKLQSTATSNPTHTPIQRNLQTVSFIQSQLVFPFSPNNLGATSSFSSPQNRHKWKPLSKLIDATKCTLVNNLLPFSWKDWRFLC